MTTKEVLDVTGSRLIFEIGKNKLWKDRIILFQDSDNMIILQAPPILRYDPGLMYTTYTLFRNPFGRKRWIACSNYTCDGKESETYKTYPFRVKDDALDKCFALINEVYEESKLSDTEQFAIECALGTGKPVQMEGKGTTIRVWIETIER